MPDAQSSSPSTPNPLLTLNYDPALERLGDDYYDIVAAAEFPAHILRFRNNDLLRILGLDPQFVSDEDFINAFGKFQTPPRPLLALRYHGYQFGSYNPGLGDGRGFLYGQVRTADRELYDFGTKGSGTTPYSRGGDGRLTLKGGIREVLAAESLHRMGVRTSRCLSLIETGDQLWRGDEPSPTRASVMIRMQRSHIRFGTFERLHHYNRKDLIAILLDHAIEQYYPHLSNNPDRYSLFYAELVQRVAELAAQWMAAGFCHAVLNTDNMSITGESFDYGPFAFIPTFDPSFTAAYFDYYGRYSYANQPEICRWNLEMLQAPLGRVISQTDLDAGLSKFGDHYRQTYQQRLLNRLGLSGEITPQTTELFKTTLQFLKESQISYPGFFAEITQEFSSAWQEDAVRILPSIQTENEAANTLFNQWKMQYFNGLLSVPAAEMSAIKARLHQNNPATVPIRPEIEAVWEKITNEDDWSSFYDLCDKLKR